MQKIIAYRYFKRRAIAEEFAIEINGKTYKTDSKQYALANDEVSEVLDFIKDIFPYIVEWESPIGYFIVEWLDEDTYTMEHYNYKDNALEAAREKWKLMSDKAKEECVAFEIVKALTDDAQTFYLENVLEVVEVIKVGKHEPYLISGETKGKYILFRD